MPWLGYNHILNEVLADEAQSPELALITNAIFFAPAFVPSSETFR